MGFRSTFVTDDCCYEWPAWFREKYPCVHFPEKGGPIASKFEAKTYGMYGDEFLADVQRVYRENTQDDDEFYMSLVFLHECDGVTRFQIYRDKIVSTEPQGWEKTDGVTHSYCYGCSDPDTREIATPEFVEECKAEVARARQQADALRANWQTEVNAAVRKFIEDWTESERARVAA